MFENHAGMEGSTSIHRTESRTKDIMEKVVQLLKGGGHTIHRVEFYKCGLRSECFADQAALAQHEQAHDSAPDSVDIDKHPDSKKKFLCVECPRKYTFKTRLDAHIRKTHTTSTKHQCKDCGAQLKDASSLRHHINRNHSVARQITQCSKCFQIVPLHSLDKHMEHHESSEKKVSAVSCDQSCETFVLNSTLENHGTVFQCELCSLGFQSKYLFQKHDTLVHNNQENKMTCEYCDKKFCSLSELRRHTKSHSEKRSIKCDLCEFTAKTRSALQQHKVKHTNVKMHSCAKCSWTFKRASELTRHQRVHSQAKTLYKCDKCDINFKYECNRNKHQQLYHKDE
ncbi:hypothetical protein QAD02_014413 [Eretmocerus hayati]|uniref:Uncharacterized protein n=1 Tax=Eretmocerus hayati TaxID=131215 RepID=A0ACC2P6W9_9HYME|nr:hypothetical protein QAD02_014413 [Eretmocerus hayati]